MKKLLSFSRWITVLLTAAILAFLLPAFSEIIKEMVSEYAGSGIPVSDMFTVYEILILSGIPILAFVFCFIFSLANQPKPVIVFNSIAIFFLEIFMLEYWNAWAIGIFYYGLSAIALFIILNVLVALIYFFAILMKNNKLRISEETNKITE